MLKKFSVKNKQLWVFIHLTFNIIYFTGIIGALTLVVFSKNSDNTNLVYAAHYFVRLFDEYLIVAGAIGSLFSGIWISVKTNWGLTKYYWIMVKLAGNILAVIFGSIFVNNWINKTIDLSLPNALKPFENSEYLDYLQKLFLGLIFLLFVMGYLVFITIFKPWGKRKHADNKT